MIRTSPAILIEFNELTPSLLHRFRREGLLPNFDRLYRESDIFTTDAEAEGDALNPWVQWVTVHSGLPHQEHGVEKLDDAPQTVGRKAIWDLLSDASYRVWVCGSMNPWYSEPLNGALLPDPWTSRASPCPSELQAFHGVVQKRVQEHTNERSQVPLGELARFAAFLATHGLSVSTALSVAMRLVDRRRDGHWKQATVLDELQLDIFRWYFRKLQPQFSTFFSNSTAFLQHRYWRDMEPERFHGLTADENRGERANAIRFGYQQIDRILGQLLSLVGPQAVVILATALSQQPYLKMEETGGKLHYRPREPTLWLQRLGLVEGCEFHPLMSEQFCLRFPGGDYAARAAERLSALQLSGVPAMEVIRNGPEIVAKCSIHTSIPSDALLVDGNGFIAPFFELFYSTDAIKSGMHHPDGMLWIRWPEPVHRVNPGKVSLCAVAPTLLELFGLPRPAYMRSEILRQ